MAAVNRGFSLVELLVALVIGGLVIILMSTVYLAQKRSAEGEAALRDINVKAQLAMNRIKQIVRNAGVGAEKNLTEGGGVIQGANQDFSDVFTAVARSDGPDVLTVVTGFPPRTRVVCTQGTCASSSIETLDAGGFDTDTGRFVYVGPSVKNRYLEITAVEGNTITLSESVTAFDGDPVFRVAANTITLDKDGLGNPMDVDGDGLTTDTTENRNDPDSPDPPDLYIYDNREDLADETDCKVTDEIEDLQFQYLVDADGNGRVEGAEWTFVDDPTGSTGEIMAVRIWLLVRSALPDPAYQDTHEHEGAAKTYRVADHLIQLDADDGNGIDSHFDHRYHRAPLVETVMVRNRNL